jgi:asparagine synthase (glutamine-hydrolysing)
MCGICGIYQLKQGPIDRELLERMTSIIQHRGPDGIGSYVSDGIGLGHRRLSIIDIAGGSQPITNEDQSLHLIFNGEIYNFIELREELLTKGHVFKTRSDTEVIIHGYEEWGLECVNRFNGIFAFALWDGRRKRLFLARDHLGVKPLYYVDLGDRLLFASEIKALLVDPACPREVDLKALGKLFTLRYVPSPDTLFHRIKKLPPGHLMVVGPEGVDIKRYWNWTPQIRSDVDEADLVETYQWLVEDAVRLQMRSDVPVGLFLSSGIDSGTLLAIMTKYAGKPVNTFTIGFEQGEGLNETDDAREMAQRFGAEHTDMIVSPEDYQQYYDRYLWDLEEPVGNETAAAFHFVSRLASQKVKVALTGQGADEPWAGYHRHMGIQLSELYSRLPSFLTQGLLARIPDRFTRNERIKRGLASLHERDVLTRFVKVYSFYSESMKERLFQPWVRQEISADGYEARQALRRLQEDVANLDPLTQMLYIDTRANLPDDLLMVADKTSMANSIEARVPFLDYRLVEFIETLPPNLKLRHLRAKYLHKKAVEKWLPRQVVYRKKKGFANPVHEWLRGRMREYIQSCLLSDRSAVNLYFNRDFIKETVAKHEANEQNYLRQIYLLISFELWHQTFIPA